jgi:hypothetical protein
LKKKTIVKDPDPTPQIVILKRNPSKKDYYVSSGLSSKNGSSPQLSSLKKTYKPRSKITYLKGLDPRHKNLHNSYVHSFTLGSQSSLEEKRVYGLSPQQKPKESEQIMKVEYDVTFLFFETENDSTPVHITNDFKFYTFSTPSNTSTSEIFQLISD